MTVLLAALFWWLNNFHVFDGKSESECELVEEVLKVRSRA